MKVGPQSCGAFPGPVCYDKGNDIPPPPMPMWCFIS
ncbi:hypothetical protein RAA17_16210 [Komagataeibacter rhaeticus]|nr:hypothetical protein [Komagataeibacter rhaeticus]